MTSLWRKTRRFHLLLLVLAVLPLMGLCRWGGPARGPWGHPTDGVQARLVCARSLWRSGEVIALTLELRNVDKTKHAADPGWAVEVRALREGHMFLRITTSVGIGGTPLDLLPGTKLKLPLPGVATRSEGAGLYELAGHVGEIELRPVKVRVLSK